MTSEHDSAWTAVTSLQGKGEVRRSDRKLEGLNWLKEAAEAGDKTAELSFFDCYNRIDDPYGKGPGETVCILQAVELAGWAEAPRCPGLPYEAGKGVEPDTTQGFRLASGKALTLYEGDGR